MKARWLPLLDIVTCVLLIAYVLAGVPAVPFHGDEPMQIYMSRDYELAFHDGDIDALTQGPPYFIDDDNQLRILNGSVHRYLVGLLRQAAGFPRETLPPRPGWDWGLDYARNVETDHRPPDALLFLGRYASAGLLAASVPVLFMIGRMLGGRPLAYAAVLIYALHPVVLLNGRRAVQEGAMLCFGLLTILTAIVISLRARRGARVWFLWPALAASGALALASKHAAAPFVAGAFAWVGLAALLSCKPRMILTHVSALAACAVVSVAGFIALSPALWTDPPARIADLFTVRAELLDLQVAAHTDGATGLGERIAGLLREPFLRPNQYFESPVWADFAPISAEIAAYEAGPWRGYITGPTLIGILLTGLMLGGLVVLWVPRLRPQRGWAPTLGLFAWLGVTAAVMLVSPLDWQRYAVPLLPVAALLAGHGVGVIHQFIIRRARQNRLR